MSTTNDFFLLLPQVHKRTEISLSWTVPRDINFISICHLASNAILRAVKRLLIVMRQKLKDGKLFSLIILLILKLIL